MANRKVPVLSAGEIQFFKDKQKKDGRQRKVISRSNAIRTIKFPSFKVGRMVHCNSPLERDACPLMDVDHSIKIYQEQPVRLRYQLNGEVHDHYPDFELQTITENIFREIKTEKYANTPEIKARTAYLTEVLPTYGYQYEVMTETTIHQQPRLKNATFLLKHGRRPVDITQFEILRLYVKNVGQLFWGDGAPTSDCPLNVFEICRLILDGYLSIRLDCDWEDDTPIEFVKLINHRGV